MTSLSPPRAIIALRDGRVVELGHGDLVGRLRVCRLVFDDPRISEAHAMLSLRGDALRLLSLRGRFTVDGVQSTDVALAPGQRIALVEGDTDVAFDVVDVVLPEAVIAIEAHALPLQVLFSMTSFFASDPPSLRGGYDPDADAWFAHGDDGWRLSRRRFATEAVIEDRGIDVGGVTLFPRLVALTDAGTVPTVLALRAAPLRIVARFQSVHIFRGDDPLPLMLDGVSALVVSELVALSGPTAWDVVARDIWSDQALESTLRGRWDAQLSRLRRRLRCAGVRPDLIRSDRHGFVELVLGKSDVVVDET